METSKDRKLNFLLKYIGEEKLEELKIYVEEIRKRNYKVFPNQRRNKKFVKRAK